MEMTLDEYLDEVDRWKQKAMERTESLSAAAREKVLQDSRRWLEKKIGRRLKVAAVPVSDENTHSTPRKQTRRRTKTRATAREITLASDT
jgi:hypothetical protein